MSNFPIFQLLSIPLVIYGILITLIRKDLKTTMLKYDNNYTGWWSNTYDMIRVFRVYKNCSIISKEEKKILKQTLIIFLIGLVDGVALLIIFFFFPELYLGD